MEVLNYKRRPLVEANGRVGRAFLVHERPFHPTTHPIATNTTGGDAREPGSRLCHVIPINGHYPPVTPPPLDSVNLVFGAENIGLSTHHLDRTYVHVPQGRRGYEPQPTTLHRSPYYFNEFYVDRARIVP